MESNDVGTLAFWRRMRWTWVGIVSVLFAAAAAAQSMGNVASSYYPGPNVSFKNVAPYKLLVTVSRPAKDDADDQWANFVRAVFQRNVSPTAWPGGWPVLVGQSEVGVGWRERESRVFKDWIADRRLRPGDILALGGPRSRVTADMMIDSLTHAPQDWAKGATLMFMGSASDKDRVFAALRSSGATLRFFDLESVRVVTFERAMPHFMGSPPLPPPPPPVFH